MVMDAWAKATPMYGRVLQWMLGNQYGGNPGGTGETDEDPDEFMRWMRYANKRLDPNWLRDSRRGY